MSQHVYNEDGMACVSYKEWFTESSRRTPETHLVDLGLHLIADASELRAALDQLAQSIKTYQQENAG